ncbi:hypothetical protein VLL29_20810, partial [Bacillus altitudinis]
WLARIFGCDDPEATSAWQAELSAAQARLTTRRRLKGKPEGSDGQTSDEDEGPPAAGGATPAPLQTPDGQEQVAAEARLGLARRS